MALSYVGGATGEGTNTSFSVTLPAGVQTGDLVIVVAGNTSTNDSNPGVSTGGYTEIADLYYNSSSLDGNLSVSWKIMGGTPDALVTVNGSSPSSSYAAVAAIHVWRGADQTTPIDAELAWAGNVLSSAIDPPAVTPVTSGAVVLTAAGVFALNVDSFTEPAGYGNVSKLRSDPSAACGVGIASKDWAGGAEYPGAWSYTGSTGSILNCWIAITVPIRPKVADYTQAITATASAVASLGAKAIRIIGIAASRTVLSSASRNTKLSKSVIASGYPVLLRNIQHGLTLTIAVAVALVVLPVSRKTLDALSVVTAGLTKNLRRVRVAIASAEPVVVRKLCRSMVRAVFGLATTTRRLTRRMASVSLVLVVLQSMVPRRLKQLSANSTVLAFRSRVMRLRRSVVRLVAGAMTMRRPKQMAALSSVIPMLRRSRLYRHLTSPIAVVLRLSRKLSLRKAVASGLVVSLLRLGQFKRSASAPAAISGTVLRKATRGIKTTSNATARLIRRARPILQATATGLVRFGRWLRMRLSVAAVFRVAIVRTRFRSFVATCLTVASMYSVRAALGWIAAGFGIRTAVTARPKIYSAIQDIRRSLWRALGGRS